MVTFCSFLAWPRSETHVVPARVTCFKQAATYDLEDATGWRAQRK